MLLEESGYIIRYEKGSFQSGYALVKDQKIIIINSFFDIEARINSLQDIIDKVEIVENILSDKSQKTYQQLIKIRSEDTETEN